MVHAVVLLVDMVGMWVSDESSKDLRALVFGVKEVY